MGRVTLQQGRSFFSYKQTLTDRLCNTIHDNYFSEWLEVHWSSVGTELQNQLLWIKKCSWVVKINIATVGSRKLHPWYSCKTSLYWDLHNLNYSRILIDSAYYNLLEDRRKDDVRNIFSYFIKRGDSMLSLAFSVISQMTSKCFGTLVTHSTVASCATFLFSSHFDVICDL